MDRAPEVRAAIPGFGARPLQAQGHPAEHTAVREQSCLGVLVLVAPCHAPLGPFIL